MFLLRQLPIVTALLCYSLLTNANAETEWISLNGGSEGQKPVIHVSTAFECSKLFNTPEECISIKFELKGFYLEEITDADGSSYYHIRVPGINDYSSGIGFPLVPSYSTLIQIPLDWESIKYASTFSAISPERIPELSDVVYSLMADQPEIYTPELTEEEPYYIPIDFNNLSESDYPSVKYLTPNYPGPLHGAKISNIELFPIQFKYDNEWVVYQNRFNIILVNGNGNSSIEVPEVSRKMADLVQASVPNFDATNIELRDVSTRDGEEKSLLVIGGKYNNRTLSYLDHPPLEQYLNDKTEWSVIKKTVQSMVSGSGYYRLDEGWGKYGQMGRQCRILDQIIEISKEAKEKKKPLEAVLLLGNDDEIPLWLEEGHGILHTNVVKTYAFVIEGWLELENLDRSKDDHALVVRASKLTDWQVLIDADRDGKFEWQMDSSAPVRNGSHEGTFEVDDAPTPNNNRKVRIRIEVIEDDVRMEFVLATYNESHEGVIANIELRNPSPFYNDHLAKLYLPENENQVGARIYIKDGHDDDTDGFIDRDLDVSVRPENPDLLGNNWTVRNLAGDYDRDTDPNLTEQELIKGAFQIGFDTINLSNIDLRLHPQRGDHAYSLRELPKYCTKYMYKKEQPFEYASGLSKACSPSMDFSESKICGDSFHDQITLNFVLPHEIREQVHESGFLSCRLDGLGYFPWRPCIHIQHTADGSWRYTKEPAKCYYGECWNGRWINDDSTGESRLASFVPIRSVGRWNIGSIAELDRYLTNANEHLAQTGSEPSASYRHLFLAGADTNADHVDIRYQGMLGAISDSIEATGSIHSVLARNENPALARNYFTNTIEPVLESKGVGFLGYYGHGTFDTFHDSIHKDWVNSANLVSGKASANEKPHYLVFAEACLTGAIQGLDRTIADEFVQNTDCGAIGYLGNSHIQSRHGSLRMIRSNISLLYRLQNPNLGQWWMYTTVNAGLETFLRTQKTIAHRVLLGDPTLPLYGFTNADIDNDSISNSEDNCLEVDNSRQHQCGYNNTQDALKNALVNNEEPVNHFSNDYTGHSDFLSCELSTENCNLELIANYTDRVQFSGNACEETEVQACVFAESVTGSEEHGPVDNIVIDGRYLEEKRYFTRTIADLSQANEQFRSSYCFCGYQDGASEEDKVRDCRIKCPNGDNIEPDPNLSTGWQLIEKWLDENGNRCRFRPWRDTDNYCFQNNFDGDDPEPRCVNTQATLFAANTSGNDDSRQLDWTHSVLPDDWSQVDPNTCWLSLASINTTGSAVSRLRIAYQDLNNADIATFTDSTRINFSRYVLLPGWRFPDDLFRRNGSRGMGADGELAPVEHGALKYYALETPQFEENLGEMSDSGASISFYNPHYSVPSVLWHPVHYGSKEMPGGLKDFAITSIVMNDVDIPLLYGGIANSGWPNRDVYIVRKEDSNYLWKKLTDIVGPVKTGASMHYNPNTNKVWMFGGMGLADFQPYRSSGPLIYWDWDYRIYALDLSSPHPTWREYLTKNDENTTPKFANMKVTAKNSSDIIYFYGGKTPESETDSPVYSFEFKDAKWTELDLEPSGPTGSCATTVRKDGKLIYYIPATSGGGNLYSYNPVMKSSELKKLTKDEIPDFNGGCHAIFEPETGNVFLTGISDSIQPDQSSIKIDPESLKVLKDSRPCDPGNSEDIEGMLCTKDDKWFQHPGEMVCNTGKKEWECTGSSNDSKWYGSYFSLGNVNAIAKSGDKVYVATDIGLQVVTIAVPYLPIFAGWASSNGSANDIAFDGDRYAFLADQSGVKIYDVNFSLIPILKSDIFVNQSVRSLRLNNDILYTTTSSQLIVFNVSDVRSPVELARVDIDDSEISDIDITDSYIYLSGQRGIHVLTNTDSSTPEYIGNYITDRAILKLKTDGHFLYLLDDIYQQQTYNLKEHPWNPEATIPHSITGWVSGVENDDEGRSVGYNWNWMNVRKKR